VTFKSFKWKVRPFTGHAESTARRITPKQTLYVPLASEAFQRLSASEYFTMLGTIEGGKPVSFDQKNLVAEVVLNGTSRNILARNVAVSQKTGTSILYVEQEEHQFDVIQPECFAVTCSGVTAGHKVVILLRVLQDFGLSQVGIVWE
jgi:hypothetical protein